PATFRSNRYSVPAQDRHPIQHPHTLRRVTEIQNPMTVVVIGHQKGRSTKENIARNFAQAQPEGFRKAQRLMEHAARFGFPILTFIDTPGASPGMQAEERGIGQAISAKLMTMLSLPVPIILTVIGDGGSDGALAAG